MLSRESLATAIAALSKRDFTIFIEDGRVVPFFFSQESFFHLLGLHYLADMQTISKPRSKSAVVRQLLKDERLFKTIQKSAYFPKVQARIEEFGRIVDMLISDTCEVIIDFDKSKVPSAKIESTLLLYKTDDHISYYLLGIMQGTDGRYYPETYLTEGSKYYVSGQQIWTCTITSVEHK